MELSEHSITFNTEDLQGKKQIWIERNNAIVYIRFFDKIEISVWPLHHKTATLNIVTGEELK